MYVFPSLILIIPLAISLIKLGSVNSLYGCSLFEAHFSPSDIRDILAVEDGKRVPVEQGKMVPRYLLTLGHAVI